MSALIFTHGFATSSESWAPQIAGLGDQFDTTTWNLPGHCPDAGVRLPDADLRGQAVDQLGGLVARATDRPYLVGHSLGGYLSLRFAISHPGAARGLVLIATGPGFRDPSRMALWNASMDSMLASAGLDPRVDELIHMSDSMVIDRSSEIQVPVLLIVGSADRQEVQRGTSYLSEKLSEAKHLVIQNARHSPHKTHSTEVNQAIADFVREVDAR
jgi:pimeloyl-ACP methyl ester carboxylesterase